MGVGIRKVQLGEQALPASGLDTYFASLVDKGLRDTYGSRTAVVPLVKNGLLQDPENLYQIGIRQIDDLFLMDVQLKKPFDIPTTPAAASSSSAAEVNPKDDKPKMSEQETATSIEDSAEFSFVVYNGSNLRAVTMFKVLVPTNRPERFEAEFEERFRKAASASFMNANIYPRGDPSHFGNLLYVYSQARERDVSDNLSCENASDVFRYYGKAAELYQLGLKRGVAKAFGQQSELHQLSSRQNESVEKSKVAQLCAEDKSKHFQLDFDFGKIAEENRSLIELAFKNIRFEDTLSKYTDKPARARFQIESNGDLSLFFEMRFDLSRYRYWTSNRVPLKYRNFQILSLDPYYALMQKLVMLRTALPLQASPQLRQSFRSLRTTLYLKTLLKGEVYFGVDGTYFPERKQIQMAYPNTIYLQVPGFDTRAVLTKNNEIFQDRGWLALGSCKTLEGTLTEDGLVYRFFGFPCQ